MDPENGMVDHLEEYVEPLITRRRSRKSVALQRFPSFATLFSRQDDSRVNITIDGIDQFEHPEAASFRGKAKFSLEEIVEENKPKAGPSKERRFPPDSPMGEDAKGRYRNIFCPLYQAALEDNWPVARGVIEKCPEAVHSRITVGQETPLHIAAAMKHESFLKELLVLMESEHLEIKNNEGNTAFCFAAASGNVKIAKLMVDRNTNLPNIRGAKEVTPLYMAALLGHRDMVSYLFCVTDLESLKDDDFIGLLFASIDSKLYDVALQIVKHRESVARARNEKGETALHVLARKPSEFGTSQQVFWRRCIYFYLYRLRGIESEYNSMHKKARELLLLLWTKVRDYYDPIFLELMAGELVSLLLLATEFGNVEFVTVLIESYPDLVYTVDTKGRSIFHVAIACRQKEIFNLIYRIGAIKDQIAYYKDKDKNNLLHLAGMLAPESHLSKISGAALQMQEELIWFKEVERIVIPAYREMENGDQKSPRVLFTEEHKILKTQGEEWMKATANSCMLAATLIATVMFAAAFTVPGCNKDVDGTPHFLKAKSFKVFAISDAVSLFSSVTSISTFLSILTSRYAEIDFLISLPIRLILGLLTLFISIVTMIVAFSATFLIVLDHDLFAHVETLVYALACVPITFFAALQFPLFADVIYSTYKASFLLGLNQRRVKKHKWT